MAFNSTFTPQDQEATAEQLASERGWLLLEFGAPWCAHCQAAQPLLAAAMQAHPQLAHRKIEDAKAAGWAAPLPSSSGPLSSCCGMGRRPAGWCDRIMPPPFASCSIRPQQIAEALY
nr:thioredoxin domain-containing protein [Aquitalea magnusonii]